MRSIAVHIVLDPRANATGNTADGSNVTRITGTTGMSGSVKIVAVINTTNVRVNETMVFRPMYPIQWPAVRSNRSSQVGQRSTIVNHEVNSPPPPHAGQCWRNPRQSMPAFEMSSWTDVGVSRVGGTRAASRRVAPQ